ncbi:MAG: hypothetical protein AAF708_17195 [Deinococcota bacterium]
MIGIFGAKVANTKLRQWFIIAILLVTILSACAPRPSTEVSSSPEIKNFFFSSDTWGSLPFSVQAKQHALVAATLRNDIMRLEEDLPFAIEPAEARVQQFQAIFEVDVRSGVPQTRSGYALQVIVPQGLDTVILTNELSGVSNAVSLRDASGS